MLPEEEFSELAGVRIGRPGKKGISGCMGK